MYPDRLPQVPAPGHCAPVSVSCTRTPELRAHLNPSGLTLRPFTNHIGKDLKNQVSFAGFGCTALAFPPPPLDTQIIADHWPPGSLLPALGLLMAGGVSVTWGTHDSSLETGFSFRALPSEREETGRNQAVPWFLQSWWPAAVFPLPRSE